PASSWCCPSGWCSWSSPCCAEQRDSAHPVRERGRLPRLRRRRQIDAVVRGETQLGPGIAPVDVLVEAEDPRPAQPVLLLAAEPVGAEAGAGRVAELDAVVVGDVAVEVVMAHEEALHVAALQHRREHAGVEGAGRLLLVALPDDRVLPRRTGMIRL